MNEPRSGQTRRLEATVRGLVQGVGYRWFVQRTGARLGLAGWVANQADGSVHLVAEGDDERLETFLEVLREGPPGAFVGDVQSRLGPALGSLQGFEIRAGGHTGD